MENNNKQTEINYPWGIMDNYPKAAAISDSYLAECEKWADEKSSDMLKASGTVKSGLTILIIGSLIAAQMPYWWNPKLQLPEFSALIGIFGLAGIGLAIFGEYYKAAPLKTSDILWGSSTRLEDFWDKFAKDQKNQTMTYIEILIYLFEKIEKSA